MKGNIVYTITNTINGRIYIGSSLGGINRINQHKSLLSRNKHYCKDLQSDYNEIGADKFKYKTIHEYDDISRYKLSRVEEYEIRQYSKTHNLYNQIKTCGSLYPNLRAAKISHKTISKAMGYSTVMSFRTSSAHKRVMSGIDELIGIVIETLKT
jgi:hypothetical protein